MRVLLLTLCLAAVAFGSSASTSSSYTGTFLAGAAKINATLPKGQPLAGYNHGARRVPDWPIPEVGEYTTFMMPSQGVIPGDATWVKALVIDNGEERFAFCTLDGIGSDHSLNDKAMEYAAQMGFTVPIEKVIFSASHSHSGPGAVAPELLWELAPAIDLFVPELMDMLARSMAQVLVDAENNMEPAVMDIGEGYLVGVTKNRRAKISPYVGPGTIDPHLGVFRVDSLNGTVLATMWNFAIHGVCYGPSNMLVSGDIMGRSNQLIEEEIGGVALFMNGDAGDIDPADGMCNGGNESYNYFVGSPLMANKVIEVREKLNPTTDVEMEFSSIYTNFGDTDLNITLARFDNCTSGGALDICSICEVLDCDANIHLDGEWVENDPRFTGMRFKINGNQTVIVSIPGEALVELGWQIRNDTQDLGFDQTILAGYSNSHMGYFATPNEYDIGGYESQLTFWGVETAEMIRANCYTVASAVQPPELKAKAKAKSEAAKRQAAAKLARSPGVEPILID